MDRGWYGVLTVPRTVAVASVSLPGNATQRLLTYEPIASLATLRATSEEALVTQETFTTLETAGASVDVRVTFDVPRGDDFFVAVRVLASPRLEEATVVTLRSARRVDGAALVYLNDAQRAAAVLSQTSVKSVDACEAACESLDACFAWTARPTTNTGAANLSCDVVGGIVPLLTATRVGCDWGRNLDFDPSLSTSGVKAKGWATLAVDRSKSRDTDGGYGKHPYVALVPVLDDGQNASLRVLADRSIVEAFAFGQALTSRVYPTRPDATRVAVAASPCLGAAVQAHVMKPAFSS